MFGLPDPRATNDEVYQYNRSDKDKPAPLGSVSNPIPLSQRHINLVGLYFYKTVLEPASKNPLSGNYLDWWTADTYFYSYAPYVHFTYGGHLYSSEEMNYLGIGMACQWQGLALEDAMLLVLIRNGLGAKKGEYLWTGYGYMNYSDLSY